MNAKANPSSSVASATSDKPPELNAVQWREVFFHLDALLEVAIDQREQAAQQLASGIDDAVVASAIRRMSAKTASSRAGLTRPAHAEVVAAVADGLLGSVALAPGQRCGDYQLIEPIGQGGMGSVWRAERIDGLYQSQVAVKLLGSLALSAHARARFAREGELLARLTHPNIARLLDAGLTDDSQRFLVLELVRGQDICTYVEAAGLDQRAILGLFRQLLDAIAFAHSQLVVHRDIKPGNVMIDASGQVKLLDFGVAKLIDADEEDEGLTRVVGSAYTEAFAAPEQVRGDPVGTAADVFSLGGLLFLLLSGAAPQWTAPKRELEAGAQPTMDDAFRRRIPVDLRAILLKSLAIKPDERYATATAFDEDVARYLDGAAVRAQPPTRLYRWRKFVTRHRWPLLATSMATVAIVASLGTALWQLSVAREQRAQAINEASRANAVTSFLTGLFHGSDPRLAASRDRKTLTAKELLDIASARLNKEMLDQPETRLSLLATMSEIYGYLEDEDKFLEMNKERIRFARERFGPEHPAVIEGLLLDIDAEIYAGQYDRAREQISNVDPLVRKVYGRQSERYATLLGTAAELERRAGREPIAQVLERFLRAEAIYRAIGSRTEDAAVVTQNYSTALTTAGRLQEALAASDRAMALFAGLARADQGALGFTHSRRAELLAALNRHDEVEREFDSAIDRLARSYGANSAVSLKVLLGKALWLHQRGRREEAWVIVKRVFATERTPSVDTFGVPEQHYVRGLMLTDEQRYEEAINDLSSAVSGWAKAGNHPTRLKAAQAALAAVQALKHAR
jgi:eukaryotic-like serine/threonine-protein kinase